MNFSTFLSFFFLGWSFSSRTVFIMLFSFFVLDFLSFTCRGNMGLCPIPGFVSFFEHNYNNQFTRLHFLLVLWLVYVYFYDEF